MIGTKRRIVIQDRDRRLLRELSVMRVIDREQAKLAGGFRSTTRANARLRALTLAGLLRRYSLGTRAGGKKALYALSRKGAALIGVPYRGPRRKAGEMIVIDAFVHHQLAINDIYCELKFKTIPVPGARFVRWVPFFKPISLGTKLIPDGYFEVTTATDVLAAFVEVDLGGESRKVWTEKIKAYLRLATSEELQQKLQRPHFRVLVLTNSERRMHSLRKLTAKMTEKIFWFADLKSATGNLWAPIWFRPEGDQQHSLIGTP